VKPKNPRLVDRLARLVFGVPSRIIGIGRMTLIVRKSIKLKKSDRVEEDNDDEDEGEDEDENDGIPRRLLDHHRRLVRPG